MCIRDSSPIARDHRFQSRLVNRNAAGIEDVDLVRIDIDAPVSYTHLRAHETVLDLVCRLLLEKKKQKHIVTRVTLYYRLERTTQHSDEPIVIALYIIRTVPKH